MMKSLSRVLFIISTLAYSQSLAQNSKVVIDRTIQYVKQVSTYCLEWTNEPTRVVNRKLLTDALASFDKIEHDITDVLITMESDQKKEIHGKEIFNQLNKLSNLASQILLNFKNDKALEDAVTVLLCQDMVETEIVPLAKDLTTKLSNLKK